MMRRRPGDSPRAQEDGGTRMGEGRGLYVSNGVLLLSRLLLGACFLPSAIGHLSNISGFAASLTMKGVPYADVAATLIVLAELFGPLALILGLAPRLSASVLIVATLVTTGALHRFWDYGGLTRYTEQAIFLAHLGVIAGLLLSIVTGPGEWSWQAWWKGAGAKKAAPKKKRPRSQSPRPRPAPARPAADEDEYADAA
jgi:putative oxidoreductase